MTQEGRELKFCNCADCGRELLGDSFSDWYYEQPLKVQENLPSPVHKRIKGRPYCLICAKYAAPEQEGSNTPIQSGL